MKQHDLRSIANSTIMSLSSVVQSYVEAPQINPNAPGFIRFIGSISFLSAIRIRLFSG